MQGFAAALVAFGLWHMFAFCVRTGHGGVRSGSHRPRASPFPIGVYVDRRADAVRPRRFAVGGAAPTLMGRSLGPASLLDAVGYGGAGDLFGESYLSSPFEDPPVERLSVESPRTKPLAGAVETGELLSAKSPSYEQSSRNALGSRISSCSRCSSTMPCCSNRFSSRDTISRAVPSSSASS